MIQTQDGLRFHVHGSVGIVAVRHQVDSREEKALQGIPRRLALAFAGIEKHPVDLLGCAVVTGMLGVAELIGIAMQRPRGGHGLIGFAPINHIHQIGFDPAVYHLRKAIKARKPFGMLKEVLHELFNGQVAATGRASAGITVIFQPGKEHGQHTIHLDVLEIDVSGLGSAELLVSAFDAHASALLLTFPRCRMPLSSRRIWKNSKPLSVRSTS